MAGLEKQSQPRASIGASLSMSPIAQMTSETSETIATFLESLLGSYYSKRISGKVNVGITELLANVIQHASKRDEGVQVGLMIGAGQLAIRVQNRATPEEYESVKAILDKIAAAAEPAELLVETISAHRASRRPGGLGLMRLVVESKFKLQLQYAEDVMLIEASFPLSGS